ncbi:MAG: DUF3313 family protein [Planctomycetota bacterium]
MNTGAWPIGLLVASIVLLAGCRAEPPPRTGFLSTYNNLAEIDRSTYRYVSDEIGAYRVLTIDPVQLRVADADTRLSEEQLAEASAHFVTRLKKELVEAGYTILPEQNRIGYPAGTLQVRLAITDARSATVLLNLHPGSKLTGAGTGGGAMEGEMVDAVTGRQLAAFIQSGRGSQFEFDQFNRLDDIKDVINGWAEQIVAELVAKRQAEE